VSARDAARELSVISGRPRREVYRLVSGAAARDRDGDGGDADE
jgi:hypothetical protein